MKQRSNLDFLMWEKKNDEGGRNGELKRERAREREKISSRCSDKGIYRTKVVLQFHKGR